jgi:hypothetical protein
MTLTGIAMSPSLARENREFAAELKFVVPSAVGEQIRNWSRANLAADPNGSGRHQDEYLIHSIYFDTPDFDVYHRRGSYGRSKFRIRRYGDAETIFLERKLRTNGMLTKRRSTVSLADLAKLLVEANGSWVGLWYHRRLQLRRLQPVCQIGYHRTARVIMSQTGPVRLTLDEQIRATPVNTICFCNGEGSTSLLNGQTIVELKYRVEIPPIFKLLMEEFALAPAKMSKYRLAASELGLVSRPPVQEAQA